MCLGLLLLLLIPLLMLFCGSVYGPFSDVPFDTKTHLINYHTEAPGENTDIPPLLGSNQESYVQAQKNAGMATGFGSSWSFHSPMLLMGETPPSGGGDEFWCENKWGNTGAYTESEDWESRAGGGNLDGIGLPDHILSQHYNKVPVEKYYIGVNDTLLTYEEEGQGSHAASIDCCSLLGPDDDLTFLNDVGLKFKTLAEICGGRKIQNEIQEVYTPLPNASVSNIQMSERHVVSGQHHQSSHQSEPQPSNLKTEHRSVVSETSEHSHMIKENTATAREEMSSVSLQMGSQSPMVLVNQQQPVYYTTTMLQPMHYVIQPSFQNTMILADAPATNLQDMILVTGTETGSSQSLIVQGQTMMSSPQVQGLSTVLVENSGLQGANTNMIHSGNLAGSQAMMLVQNQVPAGSVQVFNGSHAGLIQGGTILAEEPSGSQNVLVIGESVNSRGQKIQKTSHKFQMTEGPGFQRVYGSKEDMSTGPRNNTSSSTLSRTSTVSNTVVQKTREIQ